MTKFKLPVALARNAVPISLCLAVMLIWAVFGFVAINERSLLKQQAHVNATNMGSLVALDIARNLDVLELTLRGIEAGLTFPNIASYPLKDRNQILYNHAASADFFANLFVIDSAGDLNVDPASLVPRPVNYSDRPYFKFLQTHAQDGLYVSEPLFSKVGLGWTMPVATRLTGPDGRFAGAVVGGLRLAYITRLVQQLNLHADDTITLARKDGELFVRWPATSDETQSSAAGSGSSFQPSAGTNTPDAIERLNVTKQVGHYPLTITVGMATSHLFADWYSRLVSTALSLAALSALIAALTFWLASELRRRARSETTLERQNIELGTRREQFDAALDNMSQGLTFFDREDKLLICNRRYREIYNLSPDQTRAGLSRLELLQNRVSSGSFPDLSPADYLSRYVRGSGDTRSSDFVDTLADGRIVASHHRPLSNDSSVTTHEDITERCTTEKKMVYMAQHDALTGLCNRFLFQDRLRQAIAMTGRGIGCAVICVDLDRFKAVNDSLGHPVGDALLRAAAERLLACARLVDTVARLGGDEFAIIQLGAGRPEHAQTLANRVVLAFEEHFAIDGHIINIGVSVGVAVAEDSDISSEALLKNADVALYVSKNDGRGVVRFFKPEMEARMQLRRELEFDLRGALGRDEFEIYYQPLIHLDPNGVSGFEALLRWRHPVRGLVEPGVFIPLAEETGLIVGIGDWVLKTACCEAMTWPNDLVVAVNISPTQFKTGDLAETVSRALAMSGLRPDRLEIEITEQVLLTNNAGNLAALHRLRVLGVTVALDDFGTGYSSLSYLRSFPFDKIKIDQSFVRDLTEDKGSLLIIRAVTALGDSLNIRTLVEGVETIEQLRTLRDEGCTAVQGYLFGYPKLACEVPALIEAVTNWFTLFETPTRTRLENVS